MGCVEHIAYQVGQQYVVAVSLCRRFLNTSDVSMFGCCGFFSCLCMKKKKNGEDQRPRFMENQERESERQQC